MAPISNNQLTLRTVISYLLVIGVVTVLILYISYQARFIIAGPTLDIYSNDLVTNDRTVTLEGQAYNIVNIEINGRAIYTDERGYFKETIVLENGYTLATVTAKDRYGRTTTESRSFVFKPNLTDNS